LDRETRKSISRETPAEDDEEEGEEGFFVEGVDEVEGEEGLFVEGVDEVEERDEEEEGEAKSGRLT
jgi:hypothetical protein